MRGVVGSGSPADPRQAEIDRHLVMMAKYAGRAHTESGAPHAVTMILRSANSGPAHALVHLTHEFCRAGISAKVILARLEPEDEVRQLFATLSELSPSEPASALIRWARNPRLLDAHEQAIYGAAMCWSGDAMRRDADRRNALALFDEAAPDAVRLGRLAFAALWAASAPVPERFLRGRIAARPSGAYEQRPAAPVAFSPLRQSLQGWPLVRH
jgi:hypothetical protein